MSSRTPPPPPCLLQELKVFLETSGELGSSMRWTGMMPPSASVLEGTAKFSMQLIGRESKVSRSSGTLCYGLWCSGMSLFGRHQAQGIGAGKQWVQRPLATVPLS